MRTDVFEFELPRELIATEPPAERDGARLLVRPRDSAKALSHSTVRALPSLLPRGALLVVNDTKVIPARLHGAKSTGGKVEIFLLDPLKEDGSRWEAFGRASKKLHEGQRITVSDALSIEITGRTERGTLEVTLHSADGDPWSAIEREGEVPLPPYMERAPTEQDKARYQTIFAKERGAVAAPTAGLHLSERLTEELAAREIERVSVTLHVGAGTFAPVSVDDLDAHPMHEERYAISDDSAERVLAAKREGRPVIAVGTTSVRALESWALDARPRAGRTRLLIQPGYSFTIVDGLLTNFHLPRSTLIALVMAFAGVDPVREAYAAAIAERYRFFSYGDAMLLL